jgi:hypothetical protein
MLLVALIRCYSRVVELAYYGYANSTYVKEHQAKQQSGCLFGRSNIYRLNNHSRCRQTSRESSLLERVEAARTLGGVAAVRSM